MRMVLREDQGRPWHDNSHAQCAQVQPSKYIVTVYMRRILTSAPLHRPRDDSPLLLRFAQALFRLAQPEHRFGQVLGKVPTVRRAFDQNCFHSSRWDQNPGPKDHVTGRRRPKDSGAATLHSTRPIASQPQALGKEQWHNYQVGTIGNPLAFSLCNVHLSAPINNLGLISFSGNHASRFLHV